MKKSNEFHYRVDFEAEQIEISKSFANAAQKAKTSAHKQLMDLRKAYPGFGITIYKTEITDSKQKYKNLTFDEMRRRIIEWDSANSLNIAALDKAITDKVPYPKVKQWYLGIYGVHYKRAAEIAMPVVEEAAVGNAENAVVNC